MVALATKASHFFVRFFKLFRHYAQLGERMSSCYSQFLNSCEISFSRAVRLAIISACWLRVCCKPTRSCAWLINLVAKHALLPSKHLYFLDPMTVGEAGSVLVLEAAWFPGPFPRASHSSSRCTSWYPPNNWSLPSSSRLTACFFPSWENQNWADPGSA